MSKKKNLKNQSVFNPEVGIRYRRTLDMSDQEYARMLKDARKPSIGYWIFIVTTAITAIGIGILITEALGVTAGGVTFLVVGSVLLILIIARIIHDIKVQS